MVAGHRLAQDFSRTTHHEGFKTCSPVQAMGLLNDMVDALLDATVITDNAIIMACEQGARCEWALLLLSQLEACRLHVNRVTYESALNSCDARGRQSLRLLEHLASYCLPRV